MCDQIKKPNKSKKKTITLLPPPLPPKKKQWAVFFKPRVFITLLTLKINVITHN